MRQYKIGDLVNGNKIVSETADTCPFNTTVKVNNLARKCKKFGPCDPRMREDCELIQELRQMNIAEKIMRGLHITNHTDLINRSGLSLIGRIRQHKNTETHKHLPIKGVERTFRFTDNSFIMINSTTKSWVIGVVK